tara:strand:+ start:402 stop:662 length:261 start_codon:yes stop_codon:yes gene_type:complete
MADRDYEVWNNSSQSAIKKEEDALIKAAELQRGLGGKFGFLNNPAFKKQLGDQARKRANREMREQRREERQQRKDSRNRMSGNRMT